MTAALVAAATAAGAERDRARAHEAARPLLTTTVDARRAGRRLPRSFLGLSIDVPALPRSTGSRPRGVNAVFAQLVRNLTRWRSGAPTLRVGGSGTDSSWWNPDRRPRPSGIRFDVTPDYLQSLRASQELTRMPVIFGLNLALNDPVNAAALAEQALAALPRGAIRAFELGHEPNHYRTRSFGRDADGRPRTARPPGWGFDDYLREFGAYASRLPARAPLAGPSARGIWARRISAFLRSQRRNVRLLTFHDDSLSRCGRRADGQPLQPGDRGFPTIPMLLGPQAFRGALLTWGTAASQARRARRRLALTQTEPVSCGGVSGVTDAFASALWGVDWLFLLANLGADGVALHDGGAASTPFYSAFSDGRWEASVYPLYYAMLLFAEATTRRSRLLPVASLRARVRKGANVGVWATTDRRRRTVRVVVLNKDPVARGRVRIRVRGARGNATLARLSAPGLAAKTGIAWAGRTFAAPTHDGRLVGRRRRARVERRRNVYVFPMRAAGVALLTVRVRRVRR